MIRVFGMNVEGKDFTAKEWSHYYSKERIKKEMKLRGACEKKLCLGAEVLLNRGLEAIGAHVSLPAAYKRNAHGKPYLYPPQGLFMNWSHSGTCVVCALSDADVGVDLQHTGKVPKEALVQKVLRPEERIFYDRVLTEQKQRLFYQYWTVKESFLKALGTGFHTSLDTFYVQMEEAYPRIVQKDAKGAYTCRLLEFPDAEYAAAVCIEGAHEELPEKIPVEFL